MLLFLIDIAGVDGRNPIDDYRSLVEELGHYDSGLLEKNASLLPIKSIYRRRRNIYRHLKRKIAYILRKKSVCAKG
jgi:GTP-binding protein